jgi:hypothetical protein
MVDCLGFIMAEILENAFQKAIEEQGEMEDKKQGEMEDKKQKKAPAIDSVVATGPDFIQLPKLGEKEVASDEGADAVQATAPEFNPKPTKSSMNDAGTNATAKEQMKGHQKVDSVKATAPELNPKPTKLGDNDAATEALAAEAKATALDEGASPVMATAAELNPNPTKLTVKEAVTDAASSKSKGRGRYFIPLAVTTNDKGTPASLGDVLKGPPPDKMVEDSETMATAPDSIPADIATKNNG